MKIQVYKVLVAIIAVVSIYSCQNEEVNFNENNEELNNENLYDFAKKTVEINNEIFSILGKESIINQEVFLDELPESNFDENKFKLILQEAGIINFNELSDLIFTQVQNGKNFQLNNPVFAQLNETEKEELLTKYVDEAMIELSLKSNANNRLGPCETQLETSLSRCERDANIHGAFALASCFTGPWTCALATTAVLIEHTNCVDDANVDYENCQN